MACEHVFNENSFSLMEALVNGSVLLPVGKASSSLVCRYLSACMCILTGQFVKCEHVCATRDLSRLWLV